MPSWGHWACEHPSDEDHSGLRKRRRQCSETHLSRRVAAILRPAVAQPLQTLVGMSARGNSRLNWTALVMSGLPPAATVARTSQIGGFVPKGNIRTFAPESLRV